MIWSPEARVLQCSSSPIWMESPHNIPATCRNIIHTCYLPSRLYCFTLVSVSVFTKSNVQLRHLHCHCSAKNRCQLYLPHTFQLCPPPHLCWTFHTTVYIININLGSPMHHFTNNSWKMTHKAVVIKEHIILSNKTLSVTKSEPTDTFNQSLHLLYELLMCIKKGISDESQDSFITVTQNSTCNR